MSDLFIKFKQKIDDYYCKVIFYHYWFNNQFKNKVLKLTYGWFIWESIIWCIDLVKIVLIVFVVFFVIAFVIVMTLLIVICFLYDPIITSLMIIITALLILLHMHSY